MGRGEGLKPRVTGARIAEKLTDSNDRWCIHSVELACLVHQQSMMKVPRCMHVAGIFAVNRWYLMLHLHMTCRPCQQYAWTCQGFFFHDRSIPNRSQ